jgi:hypothetical protein
MSSSQAVGFELRERERERERRVDENHPISMVEAETKACT